jgi:hypothetical protein
MFPSVTYSYLFHLLESRSTSSLDEYGSNEQEILGSSEPALAA